MVKFIQLFLLLFGLAQAKLMYAQPKYVAEYTFQALNQSPVVADHTILLIDETKSVYRSLDRWRSDEEQNIVQSTVSATGAVTVQSKPKLGSDMIICNTYTAPYMQVYKWLLRDFLWSEAKYAYQWELLSDTATISGIKCLKARAVHPIMKEEIEAWYCSDIGIPVGPSRFVGLPGLIVRVKQKSLQVDLTRFSTHPDATELKMFELPQNPVVTTMEKFNKMISFARQNPEAFQQQMMAN